MARAPSLSGRSPHHNSHEEYGSPGEWIDTLGLAVLIEVLNRACDCEHPEDIQQAYFRLEDCYLNPLNRWWAMNRNAFERGTLK